MSIARLKEMFSEMVLKKNASLIPQYYHPAFLLYTNEQTMDYDVFLEKHVTIYATDIQYQIEYDEDAFVEQEDKVAARVWITVAKPQEEPKRLEVILIAEYKDNRLYRLWELTYPDWSKASALEAIS